MKEQFGNKNSNLAEIVDDDHFIDNTSPDGLWIAN